MGARSWTDEQLIEAVKTSSTGTEVARKVGLTTYGANSRTINKRIGELQLDTSHFLGQRANSGKRHKGGPERKTWKEILIYDEKDVKKNQILKYDVFR